MQYDVYIAGSMTGRKVSDVLFERAETKAMLTAYGLTYYDPAEDEDLEKLDHNSTISNAFDVERMRKYVSKDLAAVAECRSVLNITGDMASDGTGWEMAYAVYYRHIPVILVAPLRTVGSKMSFTNILVDGIYANRADAIVAVAEAIKENA